MNTCIHCLYTVERDDDGAWVIVGDPFMVIDDHKHEVTREDPAGVRLERVMS